MYRKRCKLRGGDGAPHTLHTLKGVRLQERDVNGDLPYAHGYVSFVLP